MSIKHLQKIKPFGSYGSTASNIQNPFNYFSNLALNSNRKTPNISFFSQNMSAVSSNKIIKRVVNLNPSSMVSSSSPFSSSNNNFQFSTLYLIAGLIPFFFPLKKNDPKSKQNNEEIIQEVAKEFALQKTDTESERDFEIKLFDEIYKKLSGDKIIEKQKKF